MKYLPVVALLAFVACSKKKEPPPAPEVLYASPVPGKPGYVTSPYAPKNGYIDVRGFPPNTQVKDPYSGKIFIVP